MRPIPIGVSVRHLHLCQKDCEILFGHSKLTIQKELSQPGQFAANETVEISANGASLKKVRILGPFRDKTQVELSRSDAITLKINPPVRDSGNLEGSESVKITGPSGSLHLRGGVILAYRHIHMSPDEANAFKVKDKDLVSVSLLSKKPSQEHFAKRRVIFLDVLIRVNKNYRLDFHIDTDEANAALIFTGDLCQLESVESHHNKYVSLKEKTQRKKSLLIDELTVMEAYKNHNKIKVTTGMIITPSAKSLGSRLGILIFE